MSNIGGRRWGRITLAWLATIGVDLLFHAGLFAGVFDQSREPSLLTDEELFGRIPFAYAALLGGVVVLAWVLERTGSTKAESLGIGAAAGLVIGVLGLGALWTAIDITGLLVVAGTVVLVAQGITAARVLTSSLEIRALSFRVLGFVIASFVAGQVAANLLN